MRDAYHVEVTATAERDLAEICEYLARESPAAADRWLDALDGRLRSLEELPLRCPRVPESKLLGVDWRHLLLPPYRIIFQVAPGRVLVLRVIHGARRWEGTV